jgi:hypothetical protein
LRIAGAAVECDNLGENTLKLSSSRLIAVHEVAGSSPRPNFAESRFAAEFSSGPLSYLIQKYLKLQQLIRVTSQSKFVPRQRLAKRVAAAAAAGAGKLSQLDAALQVSP